MDPSLRARVIAEWRGFPEKKWPRYTAKPIGEAVEALMVSLGLEKRLKEAQVMDAYAEVVGPFLALHSSPHSVRDGVLTIRVLQPTIRFELERVWKKEILDRFKQRFGSHIIRKLEFRMG